MFFNNCFGTHLFSWAYDYNVTLNERLPDELIIKLVTHWKCFPAPSKNVLLCIGVLFVIIAIISVFFNLVILHKLMVKNARMKTFSDYLVMNLISADLIILVWNMPQLLANCLFGRWLIPYAAFCSLYGFFCALSGSVSIITFVMISIDRYLAIVQTYNVRKIPKKYVFPVLISIWLYCFLWTIPPFIGWNEYVLEGGLVSCSFNYLTDNPFHRSYILSLFVAIYCLPLSVILFNYTSIMVTIWQTKRQLRNLSNLDDDKNENRNKLSQRSRNIANDYKAFKILIFSVILWIIAWTPYSSVVLHGFFGGENSMADVTPIVALIPSIFAKLAFCYNPILYALKNPIIKYELMNKLRKLTHINSQ